MKRYWKRKPGLRHDDEAAILLLVGGDTLSTCMSDRNKPLLESP